MCSLSCDALSAQWGRFDLPGGGDDMGGDGCSDSSAWWQFEIRARLVMSNPCLEEMSWKVERAKVWTVGVLFGRRFLAPKGMAA